MIDAAPAAQTGSATASTSDAFVSSPFFVRSPRSFSGQTAEKSDIYERTAGAAAPMSPGADGGAGGESSGSK